MGGGAFRPAYCAGKGGGRTVGGAERCQCHILAASSPSLHSHTLLIYSSELLLCPRPSLPHSPSLLHQFSVPQNSAPFYKFFSFSHISSLVVIRKTKHVFACAHMCLADLIWSIKCFFPLEGILRQPYTHTPSLKVIF